MPECFINAFCFFPTILRGLFLAVHRMKSMEKPKKTANRRIVATRSKWTNAVNMRFLTVSVFAANGGRTLRTAAVAETREAEAAQRTRREWVGTTGRGVEARSAGSPGTAVEHRKTEPSNQRTDERGLEIVNRSLKSADGPGLRTGEADQRTSAIGLFFIVFICNEENLSFGFIANTANDELRPQFVLFWWTTQMKVWNRQNLNGTVPYWNRIVSYFSY